MEISGEKLNFLIETQKRPNWNPSISKRIYIHIMRTVFMCIVIIIGRTATTTGVSTPVVVDDIIVVSYVAEVVVVVVVIVRRTEALQCQVGTWGRLGFLFVA